MSPPWEKYGGAGPSGPWERYGASGTVPHPTSAPGTTWDRALGLGALGVTDSVAGVLGALPDIAGAALDTVVRGGQRAIRATSTGSSVRGDPGPTGLRNPILGSQSWRDIFDATATTAGQTVGLLPPDATTARDDPRNLTERAIYGASKGAGDAVAGLTGAGLVARSTAPMSATRGVAQELTKAPITQVGLNATGGAVTETTGDPNLGMLAALSLPAAGAVTRNALLGATAPFTESGRQRLTAQLLTQAGRRDADTLAGEAVRAGQPLSTPTATTAEATRNAGIAGLERGSRNDPLLTQLWADADAKRIAAHVAQLDNLPQTMAAGEAGDVMRSGAQRNKDLVKVMRDRATGPIYDAAKMSGERIDVGPVVRGFDAAIENSKGEVQAALRRARGYLFDADGGLESTVKGTQAAYKAIGRDISVAVRAGDNETARMLADAQKTLAFQLEQEPLFGMAQAAYREASQPLKAYDPKTAPQVARTLQRDQFNESYIMPAEGVPGQFWRAGDQGAATMRQFLSVAGNRPAAMEALQGHVVADFRKAAFSADGQFRPTEAARWLKTHEPALSTVPQIRQSIQAVIDPVMQDATSMRFARDAGRAVGSNTAQNLLAGQVIDNMASGVPLSRVPIAGPVVKALVSKGMQTGTTADLLRDELARQLMDPKYAAAALRNTAENPVAKALVNGRYLPALAAGNYGGQRGR